MMLSRFPYHIYYRLLESGNLRILAVAHNHRKPEYWGGRRDDLERAGGNDLLREALRRAWVSQDEFEQFDRVRRQRNPIVHFRRPLAPDSMEYRAIHSEEHPDQLSESDAQDVLKGVFHVLQKSAVYQQHASEGAAPRR